MDDKFEYLPCISIMDQSNVTENSLDEHAQHSSSKVLSDFHKYYDSHMKAKWNGFRIRKSRKTVFQKFPYEESSRGESIDTKIKLKKRTRDRK